MQVKEKTKQEIEEKFLQMGDYVKMDYLLSCLKKSLDFDTRKFVLIKLSGLYEKRKMFNDAARMMNSAAEINTTYQGKINDFMTATQLFIKGGNYNSAEISMKKAVVLSNDKQKEEIKRDVKEYYKTQGKMFLDKNQRKNAADIYENLMTMDMEESEKAEIRETLLSLYEKLGKIREHSLLKRKI